MAENSQLSDETKNNSTDTSSTDVSSAMIGNHENAVVPHKISNHDKLVQTMVMVDCEWINVNDTNDQANMKEDMHKVNKKVVEAQKGIVEAKNAADSAVKYADSAVSASKVNSDAIVAQSSAISEAKAATDSAAAEIQQLKANTASDAASIRADVASVKSDVNTAKVANESEIKSIQDDLKVTSSSIDTVKTNLGSVSSKLDTYAKSAATQGHDITIIKQKQGQFEVDYAGTKGDVNQIQADIKGLSDNLKDSEGDIASLQATAKELQTSMSDAQGNVSDLQATAKKYEQTFEDHSGRLSKVEQTASTLINEFSDQQGHLNRVEQTAAGTQQTVSNQQGQINTIKTDADGIHETLTGQGKQIAEINTNLDGLNTKYEGVSDNLSKLSGTVATNSTQIGQNKNSIALKADQAAVKSLSGEVNQNTAQLKVQADQISSKVSSEDFNALSNKAMQNRGTVKAPDFNTLTQAGYYTVINTGSGKNYPVTNWGTLEVSGQAADSNGRLNQKYVTDNNGGTYVRQYNTNLKTWTAWVKSANQNDIDTLNGKISKNSTAIDQNSKSIALKADRTVVDTIKNTASQNSSRLDVMDKAIQSKVTSTDVNNIINEKGFTTQSTVQSLIEQKAGTLNESITKLSNDTVTHFQSITASLDGLQTNVTNYQNDTTSKYTQLSNLMQSKVGTADFEQLKRSVDMQILDYADINNMKTNGHYFVHNLANNPIGGWVYVDVTGNGNDRIRQDVYEDIGIKHKYRRWFGDSWTGWEEGATYTEVTQLQDALNLRVQKGELLSQINIEAGSTLIQSNKIYFDADSFVMSPNSKAFIPSAYITNINADKITTGTLDAAKFNVKNFSADNIVGGTLSGVVVKTGDNDRYFQTSKDNIYWVRKGSMSLVGNDTYLNSANGLNIADMNNIQLTTWGGATVNKDGSITNNSGNSGHPKIVIDDEGKYNPDDIYGSAFGGGPGDSEIAQWVGNKEYTVLTRNQGFTVHLNDGNNKSIFAIQKDNKLGFYVGGGDDGNVINVTTTGTGNHIAFTTDSFDIDGEVNVKNNHGINVKNLHVTGWLGVDGSKNSIVKTSQGTVAINAYETAEYYFGDVGEGQTDSNGVAYVGIEKLFNETVNTSIPYQVFITAYGPGNVWVEQRKQDRFMVKSDQPNIKFGWEIKAKRKGYEHTRLQNVDNKLNHMEATS
ncbi:pyocin knob domain-containing protein [Limosilactobacillus reuteri]|uniref:pyocin knob domain-containing protein n=1 Tax=Limosilactobacillus reuteri TaxID=1598 RepID=UPI00146CFB70|nr:pyocin knob domain-containing protein [Limosilactobacillus reuteri]NMV59147.1 hypothetical protein [Limosilactobacillus reuteri]